MTTMTTERILVLCSGNYFRSRFAEIFLNHVIADRSLPWQVDSAGLLMENDNEGNISRHTQAYVEAKGWDVPARPPKAATTDQFQWATRVIALKETEHRAPIEARFSEFLDKVEFWMIHDEDVRAPADILPDLEAELTEFVKRIQG
jgi:Protein-tyrosine-phosphatase